jgi:hypothetical protein
MRRTSSRDVGSRVALRRTGGVPGRARVRLVRAPREDGVALSRGSVHLVRAPRESGVVPARGRSVRLVRVARARTASPSREMGRRRATVSRFACSRRTQCLGRERRGHERTPARQPRTREAPLQKSTSRRPRQLPTGGREDEADGGRRATTARVSRCDEPAASPVAPVSVSFARRARTASPSREMGRGHDRLTLRVLATDAVPGPRTSRSRTNACTPAADARGALQRAFRVDLVSFRPAGERTKQMANVARPRLACRAATNRRRLRSHPCPSRSRAARGRRRPLEGKCPSRSRAARGRRRPLERWGEAARPSHASRARDGRSAWAANVAVTNERLHASRGRERRLCRRALRVDLVSFRPAGERTKQMADVARPRLACRAATNRRRLRSHPCPSRSRAARGRRRPLEGKGGHPCPSRSCAGRGRRRRSLEVHLDGWREAATVSRFACSRRTQCLGRERRGHERTRITPRARRARARRARGRAPCGGACSRGASSGTCCRRARRRRRGST